MVFSLDFKLFHPLKTNTEMLVGFTSGRGRRVGVETPEWAGAGGE